MPDVVLLPDRERRCKHLVSNLEEKREYWKLKKTALGWSQCRTRLEGLCTCHKTDYRMHDILLQLCVELSENVKCF